MIENKALALDRVERVIAHLRPYPQVMEAWRTSCPRLSMCEDTVDVRLVIQEHLAGQGYVVKVMSSGLRFLRSNRPVAASE